MNWEFSDLKQCFTAPLPGKEAQYRMAVSFRNLLPDLPPMYQAAVLVLLYKNSNQLFTTLMKRPVYKGAHSGQISFPGGRKELSDQDMENTALRETEEEFGFSRKEIQIAGALTPLYIPVSETMVHPFVGYTTVKPVFIPDSREVDYLIECQITDFLAPEAIQNKPYSSLNQQGIMPYYAVNGEIIWGATAMIISELLALLSPRLLQ